MKLPTMTYFLLTVLVFQIGCSPPQNTNNSSSPTPERSQNVVGISTPRPFNVLTTATRQDFLGCWSSGTGKDLRITPDQIQLSTNSFKPVSYKELKLENGQFVIELLNRPDFYFLSKIVVFAIDAGADPSSDFPLHVRDYENEDDILKLKPIGSSAWVKFDCKEWVGAEKKQ